MKRLLILVSIFSVFACSDKASEPETLTIIDNTAEVEAFYRDNPDFFKFKSIDDLPEGLNWIDGSDLPEV